MCTWNDNANNETGFRLERSINGGPFTQLSQPAPATNATSAQVPLTGIAPGDQVALRVKSVRGNMESEPSNSTVILLPLAPGPNAPSNFTAALSGTSAVNCAWKDNANNETGFRLEQSINGGAFTELATPALKKNAKKAKLVLTGVVAGDQVTLRVKAINANGPSTPSNTAAVTVPLAAPSTLKAKLKPGTEGRTAVTLTYRDLSSGETGFKIERAGPDRVFQEVKTVDANVTSTDVTGLTANTRYSFRVRAFKAALNSSYSNTASAKTKR
jgi:hypothetical protein